MKHYTKLIRPYLIWSIVIICVPFLLIILYSLTTGGNDLVNIRFTLDNFKKISDVSDIKAGGFMISLGAIFNF